jgi:MAF protein
VRPAAATAQLVLASASPRRRGLMAAFRTPARVIAPEAEEEPRRDAETPEEFVVRLSASKAREVSLRVGDALVVGADTGVIVDNDVMGKPRDREDAAAMLYRLRGRTHRVVTGVTLVDGVSGRARSAYRATEVLMRRYADDEISAYIDSGSPFDKAGGYAVQDPVFAPAETVNGCYLNVVGLPLCDVVTLLARMGADAELDPGWTPPPDCVECPLRVAEAVR